MSTRAGTVHLAIWFTSNAPAAYLTCTEMFSTMDACTTEVFGFIPVTVNLCHTLCHLITGVIGMIAVTRSGWTFVYAIVAGVYYIAWGVVGLTGGEHVRHHLGVDEFGSWVHIVEGVMLLATWIIVRMRIAAGTHPALEWRRSSWAVEESAA